MTARCTICNKFIKSGQQEGTANGKMRHARGTGCRKGEPILTVNEVPEPPKVPTATRIGTVTNTGPINGLAGAFIKSGLVKVESRP